MNSWLKIQTLFANDNHIVAQLTMTVLKYEQMSRNYKVQRFSFADSIKSDIYHLNCEEGTWLNIENLMSIALVYRMQAFEDILKVKPVSVLFREC